MKLISSKFKVCVRHPNRGTIPTSAYSCSSCLTLLTIIHDVDLPVSEPYCIIGQKCVLWLSPFLSILSCLHPTWKDTRITCCQRSQEPGQQCWVGTNQVAEGLFLPAFLWRWPDHRCRCVAASKSSGSTFIAASVSTSPVSPHAWLMFPTTNVVFFLWRVYSYFGYSLFIPPLMATLPRLPGSILGEDRWTPLPPF